MEACSLMSFNAIDSRLHRNWCDFPIDYPIKALEAFRQKNFLEERVAIIFLQVSPSLKRLMPNEEARMRDEAVCGNDLDRTSEMTVNLLAPLNRSTYFNRLEQLFSLSHIGSVYVTFKHTHIAKTNQELSIAHNRRRRMSFSFFFDSNIRFNSKENVMYKAENDYDEHDTLKFMPLATDEARSEDSWINDIKITLETLDDQELEHYDF